MEHSNARVCAGSTYSHAVWSVDCVCVAVHCDAAAHFIATGAYTTRHRVHYWRRWCVYRFADGGGVCMLAQPTTRIRTARWTGGRSNVTRLIVCDSLCAVCLGCLCRLLKCCMVARFFRFPHFCFEYLLPSWCILQNGVNDMRADKDNDLETKIG